MKKETQAIGLILLAFCSGMVLTAATSGCDARQAETAKTALPKLPAPISMVEVPTSR